MSEEKLTAAVDKIAEAASWNGRVALIRAIPEEFGKSQHQAVYAAVAQKVYVSDLAPDFAYIHWRDEYELKVIKKAYERAHSLTKGFADVDPSSLAAAIRQDPSTLMIFRLLLGLTTQEFAVSCSLVAEQLEVDTLSNSAVKSMEGGRAQRNEEAPRLAAIAIDRIIRGELFPPLEGDVRTKIEKPDTLKGWRSVREYAASGVRALCTLQTQPESLY